jgi:CheY-like chemotaxis protein
MLASAKIDLERIQFLLVDDNAQSVDIMSQVVSGFGCRNIIKCTSAEDAKAVLGKTAIDFLLTDAQMPVEDGYALTKWVRSEGPENNRFIPIIIVTGHTPRTQVMRARDCGAHFVVAKPLTPKVLLERIFWVAQDERKFIVCDVYSGPDRRFQRLGPPVGTEGRRSDDLSGDIGEAAEPNMSQDDINALMKPAKVAL